MNQINVIMNQVNPYDVICILLLLIPVVLFAKAVKKNMAEDKASGKPGFFKMASSYGEKNEK